MKYRKANGFSFVELLIVLALMLVFFLGTASLFYLSIRSSTETRYITQARSLVQEGMEAIIAIRDLGGAQWDWTTTPVNTQSNEYYQPSFSGSSWLLGNKLSFSPATPLPSPWEAYTRVVKIEQVQRAIGCGQAVCSIVTSGGVVDPGTRKITVIVSWQEDSGIRLASASSYLIHWR